MLAILFLLAGTNSARAAEVVVVVLRATTTASGGEITVGDVATLEGGDAALRHRLERLDLSDPPKPGQTVQASREQVGFRRRLAGIDRRRFRLEDAPRSVVRLGRSPFSEDEVVAAARQLLMLLRR